MYWKKRPVLTPVRDCWNNEILLFTHIVSTRLTDTFFITQFEGQKV